MTRAEALVAATTRIAAASRGRHGPTPYRGPCVDGCGEPAAGGSRYGKRCRACHAKRHAVTSARARARYEERRGLPVRTGRPGSERACGCRPKGPHAAACREVARREGYRAALADLRRELAALAVKTVALEGPVPARAAVFEVVGEAVETLEARVR